MLNSKRLTYHFLSESNRKDYIELSMNAEVMRYITGRPLSYEEAGARFDKNLQVIANQPGTGSMAVHLKSNGHFIGCGKVVYLEDGRIEIGYSLLPPFWGQGYGSEIAQACIQYARTLHTHELMAITDPVNRPSIKILERLGFELYKTGDYFGLPAAFFKHPLG
ncbi:MAG: GNAT family N-acetyltransferase [Bacteroidota bacterium]